MGKARNLADLLDDNGDVKSANLDNAPASNNASALTTGTLPIARIADDAVTNAKMADDAINSAQIADGAVDDAHIATGITASKLTGALPAISAASLTNVPKDTTVGGRKNLIINGGFDVWQRGTSQVSATNVEQKFFADRFGIYPSGGTITADRVAFTQGQTTVPGNPNYHARIAMASGNANNWALIKTQLENPERLANKTFTISFWAKGTNPGGGKFQMYENMYHNNGGTIVSNSEFYTDVTVTSSWQKFTFTKTEAAWNSSCVLGNNNYYYWSIIQPSADTSTNAWTLDIANIQLELGSTATDFEQRSYGEELSLCQRYYYAMPAPFGAYYSAYGTRWFTEYSTYPVVMRANPSVSYKSGSVRYSYYQYGWQSDNLSALATKLGDQRGISLCMTATGSYSPSNHAMYTAESNSYVANIDAEL